MAWTSPMTAVANATFTAAQFNTHVRDNLNETAPAKATLEGQYPVATGANAIAMRRAASASALATQNTTSTSYTVASGPSVTVTTGETAMVFLFAQMTVNTNSESAYYSCEITGASSVAGSDGRALTNGRYSSQFLFGATAMSLYTGLTPGSNTFTGVIRVSNAAATGTFDNRRIVVVPF